MDSARTGESYPVEDWRAHCRRSGGICSAVVVWMIRHGRQCTWCGLFTASFAVVTVLLWL